MSSKYHKSSYRDGVDKNYLEMRHAYAKINKKEEKKNQPYIQKKQHNK